MEKVKVRVVGKPYRRKQPGETLEMNRRDARIMVSLRRVEYVDRSADRSTYAYATDRHAPEAEVAFSPSEKLDEALDARREKGELRTPEAPVETVAHTEAKPKRKKRSRKKKGE